MAQPLSIDEFSDILISGFAQSLCDVKAVAVGLSGGPDSMALTRLLSLVKGKNGGPDIHAITVDHGLRPESASEAAGVARQVQGWPGVTHQILKWEMGAKSRIQEEARAARYDLMAEYCRAHGIKHLFLAHHMDDQAETFLFRLAKGSGLDGLSGMKAMQEYGDLIFLRPLLDISKDRLLATCEALGLEYVTDPSNQSDNFARIRLRKSWEVLESEGLTIKRLAVTAKRLNRARQSLEEITAKAASQIYLEKDTSRIVLSADKLGEWPSEVVFRVLLGTVGALRSEADYAPRMESLEEILDDLMSTKPFRKRTLGGLIFERDDKAGLVKIEKESSP